MPRKPFTKYLAHLKDDVVLGIFDNYKSKMPKGPTRFDEE